MDTLVMTRARYRRRYGSDMPDATVASRFLEEVPSRLVEDLGSSTERPSFRADTGYGGYGGAYGKKWQKKAGDEYSNGPHYNYEDEDQSGGTPTPKPKNNYGLQFGASKKAMSTGAKPDSIDNIASFFGGGGKFARPKMDIPEPNGATHLGRGSRVRHPKYGDGVVAQREGDGPDAKLTVQFTKHGVKKLVEKFAQLEKL
jgi:DNA helicase-2/ATP-dependent DNA helicase PcrA